MLQAAVDRNELCDEMLEAIEVRDGFVTQPHGALHLMRKVGTQAV